MTDVYQKVREGHHFDLLERGFQSATERNSSHISVRTVNARGVIIAFILYLAKFYYGGLIYN
jgi:hypothetical protein